MRRGAAIWTGGVIVMIAVGGVIIASSKRKVIERAHVAWINVSWGGMVLALATGVGLMVRQDRAWDTSEMALKLSLIALAIVIAVVDGWLLFRSRPWVQTSLQALLIIFSLGIFGASVAL